MACGIIEFYNKYMFISFIGYADRKCYSSCHTLEEEGWTIRPNMKYKRDVAAASMMDEW